MGRWAGRCGRLAVGAGIAGAGRRGRRPGAAVAGRSAGAATAGRCWCGCGARSWGIAAGDCSRRSGCGGTAAAGSPVAAGSLVAAGSPVAAAGTAGTAAADTAEDTAAAGGIRHSAVGIVAAAGGGRRQGAASQVRGSRQGEGFGRRSCGLVDTPLGRSADLLQNGARRCQCAIN